MKRICHVLAAAAGCVAFAMAGQAVAQNDFYAGKTISIIVGSSVGGGFDLYSRALAATMPKYIPGSPSFVVQNMSGGGGSQRAASQIYSAVAKDGTNIGIAHASVITYQLLGGPNTTYESDKLAWLGRLTHTNHSILSWTASGITTIDDAKKKEVPVGTAGAASPLTIYPMLANQLLGTKFKLIYGYESSNSVHLALEAREIDAHAAGELDGMFTRRREWVESKKVSFLVQFGDRRDPRLPNVPTMKELVANDQQRQLVDIISLPVEVGYSYFVSPDVPADRQAILREAFKKTLEDPEFKAAMEKLGAPVRYETPEALSARVAAIAAIPGDIKKQAADLILPK